MRFRFSTALFVLFLLFFAIQLQAETIHYSSDGKPVKADSPIKANQPKDPAEDASAGKNLTPLEKLNKEAEEAAASGFSVDQTVKVVNGIIFKLHKEPDTGRYTFKLYRVVKKPVAPVTPEKKVETSVPPVPSTNDSAEPVKPRIKIKQEDINPPVEPEKKPEEQEEKDEEKTESKSSWLWSSRDSETPESHDILSGNVRAGFFVLEARHSFLNRKTVLKKRTVTTEYNVEDDANGVGMKDLFSTDMHEDSLFIRYGITNSVEVFLKGCMFYQSLSESGEMEPGYGAGFRVIIDEYPLADDSLLYLGFSGSYTAGKVKGEFTDTFGSVFKKASDFTEMEIGIGGRWVIGRLSAYGTFAYVSYSEDTVKTQVIAAPDIFILRDDMEQQGNMAVYGGIDWRLTNHINAYLEYHALNRQGPVAGMVYSF
ncbi:MAG: hypothetical protein WC799_13820 [Desulfobacteraceae bacterium]|jgi:hypothetical protein